MVLTAVVSSEYEMKITTLKNCLVGVTKQRTTFYKKVQQLAES